MPWKYVDIPWVVSSKRIALTSWVSWSKIEYLLLYRQLSCNVSSLSTIVTTEYWTCILSTSENVLKTFLPLVCQWTATIDTGTNCGPLVEIIHLMWNPKLESMVTYRKETNVTDFLSCRLGPGKHLIFIKYGSTVVYLHG